jgi:major vault protein
VRVVEKRVKIPLDENEGIYVRNKKTGKVSTVKGETYMLRSDEVLWDKKLTPEVSSLLQQSGYRGPNATAMSAVDCVPWKLVTYRVPHNAGECNY